ncbi:MAG: hypothetical protein KF830_16960 [Planctomycetes bacterium]|nr:hypothetical protein [Planctomycetota bacterium]
MVEVFVVDRSAFFAGDWPQGFRSLAGSEGDAFLEQAFARGRFVDRSLAEATPDWKQWIPYCVLRCWQGPPSPAGIVASPEQGLTGLLWVQRTQAQGEARLHGSWSIGIGGHVDTADHPPGSVRGAGPAFFSRALARELAEELAWEVPLPAPRFLGLLNDDATPVGRVHAGLVYACDLVAEPAAARAAVRIREISKMRGGFGSLAEFRQLWQDPTRFESWSRFLVDVGAAGPIGASPSIR